eukprot:1334595-Pleurochrysis_carterae.AAC.1
MSWHAAAGRVANKNLAVNGPDSRACDASLPTSLASSARQHHCADALHKCKSGKQTNPLAQMRAHQVCACGCRYGS